MRSLLPLLALVSALLPLPALAQGPGAAAIPYGAGCRDAANSVNAPVLIVNGLPQLGAQITVRYLGPNGEQFFEVSYPFLITGTGPANIPVPKLTPTMATNCALLVDPVLAVYFMPVIQLLPIRLDDRLTYTIPNDGALLGRSVYHQYGTMVFSTIGSPPPFEHLLFSNGMQIYVGL
jgi:hypothetical protein